MNAQIKVHIKEAFKSLTSFSGSFLEKNKQGRLRVIKLTLSDAPLDAESEDVFEVFEFELEVGQKRVSKTRL